MQNGQENRNQNQVKNTTGLHQIIQNVRAFNRFYTNHLGLLRRKLLGSDYSLMEGRVLYEIANRDSASAVDLSTSLQMDAGHISRVLRDFSKRGLLEQKPHPTDSRKKTLHLTPAGQDEANRMRDLSEAQLAEILSPLPAHSQRRITQAMQTITSVLQPSANQPKSVVIRQHKSGDFAYILSAHTRLYAQEQGWTSGMEDTVLQILAGVSKDFNHTKERCWIAEIDGERMGSIILTYDDAQTARVRLFLVDPRARGLGIGGRLVQELISFAKEAGYARIVLWTQSDLHSARKIYEANGFTLTDETPHSLFGVEVMGQSFELVF